MGALIAALGAKTTAGAALAQGVTTGATLGAGVAPLTPVASGIFSAAQPALAGLPSALAPTAGLPSLLTPTAGIFSKAMPALAGLPSTFTGPGLLNTMGMSPLGGMASMVPAGTSLPGAAGLKSLAMANAPLYGGEAFKSLSMANAPLYGGEAAKLTNLGFKSAQLPSNFIKVADTATKGADLATKTGADFFSKAAGQVPGTSEANALMQQAKAGEAYNTMAANQARVAADAARSQKLAIEAGLESPIIKGENFLSNFGNLLQNPSMDAAGDYFKEHPGPSLAAGYGLYKAMQPRYKAPEEDKGMIRPYEFAYNPNAEAYAVSPTADSREQVYFNPVFTPKEPIKAAEGGIMALAVGGPVEQMAAMNAVGANTGYPMAGINTAMYSNPMVQRPEAVNVLSPSGDAGVTAYSGEPKFAEGGDTKDKEPPYAYTYDPKTLQFTQTRGPSGSKTAGGIGALVGGQGAAPVVAPAAYPMLSIPAYQTPEQQLGLTDFYAMMNRRLGAMGGYAEGGDVYDLGSYSDGGRLLRGPGDGVSDSIPAVIGNKQPARLADGEFVIPARIVSELGNGSTEAGARKLYAMMDRVQKARSKTVGKNKVAANTRADKHLPA